MDPTRLQHAPIRANNTSYRLNLTDASANLASMPVGGYLAYLDSTETKGCTLRVGAAAVAPTHGGGAVTGAIVPPGVPMSLELRAAADLHAIMNAASATGTLYLTRVR